MGQKRRSRRHGPGRQRISLSLPPATAAALDRLVGERGFPNRSQAVAELIEERMQAHLEEASEGIMAGTITLFLDATKPGLLQRLKAIQRQHIAEVISVHDIFLEGDYLMEVLLVQGPVDTLYRINDLMLTCKGVSSGKLVLSAKLLPPVYGRRQDRPG